MANPSHDKGNITDAEIAGYMGWRGPGAYTEASLRKIREIIDHVLRVERATPPSPSTAPESLQYANRENGEAYNSRLTSEVDERAAFEAWAGPKQLSLRRTTSADHGLYVEQYTRDAWDAWQGRAALASRPAEVDDEGLPALPRPVWWYGGTDPYFSAEQYRQGQRDAVAAYKRKQAALQELADQAQENDMGYGAAPSHTTNKENG